MATAVVVRGRVTDRTVLLVASFGAFLAFLDATVVNVAFPSIRDSFPESTISSLSWILNAYSIVFAAFLIVSGRIADLLGRRRAFTTGVLVFTLASVVCALAPSVGFLVGTRLVQALGAAVLVPASLALVVEAFPTARRTHAVGLWGASAALASGLGPPIGGALVEWGSWRWAFLINLPFGLAALWAGRRLLVESRAPGRRRVPDLLGAVLSALVLGLLTLGLVKGDDWGWTSPASLACFLGAVLLFVGFVLSSRRARSPLIDPALLRIRAFSVGNAATIVAGMGFYAYLLTNILWLQLVWKYSVLVSGLAVVPGALVAAVLAALLGPVAERRGFRWVIVPGAIVWTIAYLWYATKVEVTPDFWGAWLPGQILSGIGVGATLPVLGSAALAAVPGGRFATASAVNSSARQIGAALGIAVLVVIIGTPSATTTVDVLRRGWVFSALCFLLTALVALFLGRVRAARDDEEDAEPSAPAVVRLPDSAPAETGGGALAAAPLLSRLPAGARERLESGSAPVDLAAGDHLFHEGDAASDMYVVKAGRLEVETDGRTVRELGAGAVLGELALLTGGTRSASVRARRDSRLLRVTQEHFRDAVGDDAAALTALSGVLAEQLADGHAAGGSAPPPPRLVAVVAAAPDAPVVAVAESLAASLRRTLSVAVPGRVGPDGLERAEADHDRVVLVADGSDDEWWRRCVRQADQLVLVAPWTARAPEEPPLGRTDADLVLVGARPPRDQVRAWVRAVQPWQVLGVDPDELDSGLRPLAARLAGRSVGLVLAGGGARAMTHIGVLAELEEAGVPVDRIVGSSLGSIVAALWASGMTAAEVEEACYSEFVRGNPFGDYRVPTVALSKGHRAEAALRRWLGDAWIEEMPRLFRASSTDLQSRAPVDLRTGPVVEAVMASIALPVLFAPRRSGRALLADGGILDNLPVRLLTERAEGPVVAVNIGMGATPHPAPVGGEGAPASERPPRIPSLGETLIRTLCIGSGGAVHAAHRAGAVVVTPSTAGVGLLEFHQLDRMVESGRAAGRALLDEAGDLLR